MTSSPPCFPSASSCVAPGKLCFAAVTAAWINAVWTRSNSTCPVGLRAVYRQNLGDFRAAIKTNALQCFCFCFRFASFVVVFPFHGTSKLAALRPPKSTKAMLPKSPCSSVKKPDTWQRCQEIPLALRVVQLDRNMSRKPILFCTAMASLAVRSAKPPSPASCTRSQRPQTAMVLKWPLQARAEEIFHHCFVELHEFNTLMNHHRSMSQRFGYFKANKKIHWSTAQNKDSTTSSLSIPNSVASLKARVWSLLAAPKVRRILAESPWQGSYCRAYRNDHSYSVESRQDRRSTTNDGPTFSQAKLQNWSSRVSFLLVWISAAFCMQYTIDMQVVS